MLSSKRALLSLASGLGVLALAGGFVVATPRDAYGLTTEAAPVPVQVDARHAVKEHEERKHQGHMHGKDPLVMAVLYVDRLERVKQRLQAKAEAKAKAEAEAQRQAQVTTPAPSSAPNYSSGGTVWDDLAKCESGGNWSINTGNGYYGGLQFDLGTWRGVGGSGYPHQASREEQIHRATILRDRNGGYGAWPSCSSQLGLR